MAGTQLTPLVGSPSEMVSSIGTFYSSLDVSTEEGKRAFLRAIADSDFTAEDVKKGTFEVEHFVCHAVQIEKDNGEIQDATRTVLIMPSGETVSFVSIGVRASLAALISLYGPPPWKPARKLELQESQSRKGRRVYRLLPA